ncbi:DUF6228 family protein [Oryzihumus leptocrescens]|uniref:Uncharacterized protein n=1 Tax=Oryzihumus leptocrescens TaxID=297536 RepID=A0A542Z9W9_9MICO|nr:DUF6228 family protein [Oryzihumus leptocrescens]TQL57091.1 hypothetical protein FB474_3865 [Oryzihumus leptocrescens]
MVEVAIGTPHGLRINADDADLDMLAVQLTFPDFVASKSVVGTSYSSSGSNQLVIYFRDLADHWRGWAGVKRYRSLEGDLSLDATHDGHVIIRAQLRNNLDPSNWVAQGEFQLEPGEELSRVITDLELALA